MIAPVSGNTREQENRDRRGKPVASLWFPYRPYMAVAL